MFNPPGSDPPSDNNNKNNNNRYATTNSSSSSEEESHGGFSTGTGTSTSEDGAVAHGGGNATDTDDENVGLSGSSSSNQSSDDDARRLNEGEMTSSQRPLVGSPEESVISVPVDHSVVRGVYEDYDDEEEDSNDVPTSSSPSKEQLNENTTYQTPPRDVSNRDTANTFQSTAEEKVEEEEEEVVVVEDDDEHEIVFEPVTIEPYIENTLFGHQGEKSRTTSSQLDRIDEEAQEDVAEETDNSIVRTEPSREETDGTKRKRRRRGFGLWRTQQHPGQRKDSHIATDTDNIASYIEPAEADRRPAKRHWFGLLRTPATSHNVGDDDDAEDPLLTPSTPSPTKTVALSDASDTPDHENRSGGSQHQPSSPPSINEMLQQSDMSRVLFDSSSPAKKQQPLDDDAENRNTEEDHLSTTSGIAISIRTLCMAGIALTLLVILSTIGTSYVGADLALRGYADQIQMENVAPPPPAANNSSNGTSTTPPPPPEQNTTTPTPPIQNVCDNDQILLEFEIQFDSKPAEVGITLRDSGSLGGSSLWALDALSFRSFSQFLRKNIFSVCLSRDPTYEFEITDAFANGLVAKFGTSTLVFGQWLLRYNSSLVANYHGDCTKQQVLYVENNDNSTLQQQQTIRRNTTDSSVSFCGEYCRCTFRLSSNRAATGGCDTNCTTVPVNTTTKSHGRPNA